MIMMKVIIAILCGLLIASNAFAAPVITEPPTGTVQGGGQITITGSGFGATGPNLILFDDFERGPVGEVIAVNAPVGVWSEISSNATFYNDGSGNLAAWLIEAQNTRRMNVFFSPSTDMFLSYRVKIPTGHTIPHDTRKAEEVNFPTETFPAGSDWKLTWLYEGHQGEAVGSNDVVVPTLVSTFRLGGNAGRLSNPDAVGQPFRVGRGNIDSDNTRWFTFNGWNRFSSYLRGGTPNPISDRGLAWAQGMSAEFGQKTFFSEYFIIHNHEGFWDRLGIPGWARDQTGDSTRVIYDDIYFAIGPNAAARVELGNNSVYDNATKLAISTPDSWSDTSIIATIREGAFTADEEVYLFVINADNEPSEGHGPLTMAAPLPPVDATCATHPSLCTIETCEDPLVTDPNTWYWYNDTCNAQPEPTCSTDPSLCLTEGTCTDTVATDPNVWTWADGVCYDYYEQEFAGLGLSPYHPSSRARYSPTTFSPFVAQ